MTAPTTSAPPKTALDPRAPSRHDSAVRKPPGHVGFVVHPRRWVVERFFAWISRNRRLWKDLETTIASAKAFLYATSVMMLIRRTGCTA